MNIKFTKEIKWSKLKSKSSATQKCKICKSLVKNCENVVPGKFVLINRVILCKIFFLEEIWDAGKCLIDDCVRVEESEDDVNILQKLEVIEKIVEFSEVMVDVVIKKDFKFTKSPEHLKEIVKTILKPFVFSENFMITAENLFGIQKIIIRKTNVPGFGRLNDSVTINKISVDYPMFRKVRRLGGLNEVYEKLNKLLETNQLYKVDPGKFKNRPVCQVLITGSSGTGKSSLVKHVALNHGCNIIEIDSEIFKPYPGETEQELDKIFKNIKSLSKLTSDLIVVLFENIDMFCPKFNAKIQDQSHTMRVCSQICNLLDDVTLNTSGIMVFATTSNIESLNLSVRRCNRLEQEILLEIPDQNQRIEILTVLLEKLVSDHWIPQLSEFIALKTPGFVGADLEVLCQAVTRSAIHQNLELQKMGIKDLEVLFEDNLKNVFPSVLRESMGMVTRSSLNLDYIAGMEELKHTLKTSVLGPLKNPEKFKEFGLKPPKGILFYGASGCAKTTIAKCLAGETQMTLISVSSAEIYSPYVGEAEKFIIKLFNKARMSAPTILFIDEIDTVVGNRTMSGKSSDINTRILSTLLTEIDGFSEDYGKVILVIGATNRPDCIDDALMRPGRFDKLIHIPAPDYKSRIQILKHISKKMPFNTDISFEDLAVRTNNFSGADLFNLCNEAALNAATKDLDAAVITKQDFDDVMVNLKPSLSEKKIQFYYNFERQHRS